MKYFLSMIGALVLYSFPMAAQFVNQGTLYISSGTPVATNEAFTNAGTFTNRGTLTLRSDLTNSAQFNASQGESILAGNTLQTITSSSALSFRKLTIQNTTSGESIRLNSSVGVTGQLALTAGIIKTSPANPLLLGESAQVTGAGTSAHIVGYVSKTGNTAFIFPLGNGTAYRPAYISPQGLPTMTFSAAYVESPPTTTSRSACLQALSDKEYWVINGSGSAQVGLPYQNVATSPEITGSLPTLRVARLGSAWEALTCNGNGGIAQGFVLSNGLQSQLGQFTLAKQGLSTQILTQPASASTVCLGGLAAVTVAATGENLGYQWKKDGQLLAGQQSATLALSSVSQADAGTYTVDVTGTYGAVTSTGFTLIVSQPVVSLISSGPITCSSMSVTLTATGGDSYTLSDGQTSASGRFVVSTADVYSVTATTPLGCTATALTGVNAYVEAPSVSLSNNGPLTCSKSTVTLTADSYVPNCAAITYVYRGPGLVDANASYGTTNVTTAGVYSLTLTDAYGCTATAQTTVTANQGAPTATLVSNGALNCTKTNVLLTASGGSSYLFSVGAAQINGGNTASVNATGVYSVTVTTVDGCSATVQTTITEDTNVPVATLGNDGPLTCAKGVVTLTASGGTSYQFSKGATEQMENTAIVREAGLYSVTVTAVNGCTAIATTTVTGDQNAPTAELSNNGPLTCTNTFVTLTATGTGSYRFSQGVTQIENGNTATVSTAGIYSVTVTAANGCTATAQTTVKADQTTPSVVLSNSGPLRCTNPTVTLTASGNGTYRFCQGATQLERSNLATVSAAGVYSVTITTANGCTATAQTTVTKDTDLPVATLSNDGPLTCAKPTVTLVAGGTGSYRFSAGATQLTEGSANATVNAAGVYSVTVTAANGCYAVAQTTVEADLIVPTVSLINSGPLTCINAKITLTATGGKLYQFSAGAAQLAGGNTATVSTAGTYSVTVTAANGCTATAQTTVKANTNLPVAVLTNSGPLTCAKPTATLTAGGIGTYRFSAAAIQIDGGNTARVATAGVYSVTVTSENGCAAVATTTVELNNEISAPTLTASALVTEKLLIQVTASGCAGTISWTVQGGMGVADGAIYALSQPANYTLTATCTVGSCTSPAAPSLSLQIRPGGFAIRGVELVRCQLVDAGRGQYEVSLTPQYSGLSGSPIRFGITNELALTTAPGPYSVRLYTDNPAITLTATQDAQQASYRYSWLAACTNSQPAPNRAPMAQSIPDQVLVVGQPYQLELSNYFTDPDGQVLSFTARNLPAGLSLSGSHISGSPTQAGPVTVALTALDPGGLQAEGSVVLRVDAAPVTPTPGVFSIAGVTGVRCETVTASERRLIFSPVYSGLTGEPIRFGITNEVAPTSAPGPYAVRLYTDNPAITLTATQGGSAASYRYEWLAACASTPPTPPTGNRAPVVGTGLGNQTAQAGQGYTRFIPAGTFTDPDNDALQLSVSGLPAGLSYSSALTAITGTPAQAGSATVQVTATDPGGLSISTSFVLTVQPAATSPTPGVFSIAGVTGVRCETVTASERRLIFSPVYTGLTGEPISFGITNEVAPTSAPGPYAVRLYTDNPAITLTATQGGSAASYRYNWLAACTTSTNGRQAVAEANSPLSVVVLGNPIVGEWVEVLIGGVDGQVVELSLSDLAGNRLYQQSIQQAANSERVTLPVSTRQVITILKVNTASQQQTVKLIRQ